jgi:XTP/dITP diphosphohydrolase
MKIIFATHNQGKLKEMRELLPGFEVMGAEEAGVFEDVIEDGQTFAENALKKAQFVVKKTGQWAVADDSGICIEALGGAPGIMSARWAESDEDKINLTLEKLKDVPEKERGAWIEAALALVSPDGRVWIFDGRVDGQIAFEPRGENRKKLPYDKIFIPAGHDKTFAEMTAAEKHILSHRGRAFRKLKEFLDNFEITDNQTPKNK